MSKLAICILCIAWHCSWFICCQLGPFNKVSKYYSIQVELPQLNHPRLISPHALVSCTCRRGLYVEVTSPHMLNESSMLASKCGVQRGPPELIINLDQTGIKIVPVSCWTMGQKIQSRLRFQWYIRRWQVANYSRLCYLPYWSFCLSSSCTYQGKAPACLPTFNFPSDWNVTYMYTPNQSSN